MIKKSLFYSIVNPPQGATHFDENQFYRIGFRELTYRWTELEWKRSSKPLTESMELQKLLERKNREVDRLKEQSKTMINRTRTSKLKTA